MAQEPVKSVQFTSFLTAEFLGGNTFPPTNNSPKTKNEKGLMLHFGQSTRSKKDEWAYRLKYPNIGFTVGVIDYGNPDEVGYSIVAMPFLENKLFNIRNLYVNLAMGGALFTTKYQANSNSNNNSITTNITWAFKLFFHYALISSERFQWKLGLGYLHKSNGHVRLPNEGLNSIFASTSFQFNNGEQIRQVPKDDLVTSKWPNTTRTYFSFRAGIGQNVLSKSFNEPKEVYTVALSMGKIYNNTFKYGAGLYYRFYEHYYDYIIAEEELVRDYYLYFTEAPFLYASNLAIYGSFELLLNRVGVEVQIGFNLFKPAYKIDRQLGQSYYFVQNGEEYFAYADLDLNFELKQSISTRLGLKYYFLSTNEENPFNVFLGANLNANFGQADFNELSLGVVYNFNRKQRE